MKHKFVTILSVSLISIAASTGCATSNHAPKNGTDTIHTSQVPDNQLTESKVRADIQNNEKGHVVNDIHIINLQNMDRQSAAFASFTEDGKREYINLFTSAAQGTGYGKFLAAQSKGNPIQSDAQAAEDGFALVTGVIVDNPKIKYVLITFASGHVEQVPVHDGTFWYFGRVGTSEVAAYTKHFIGVTDQGDIIMNRS